MIKGLISIITPVYNSIDCLDQCLDSVISQTDQRWELLLVEDGSTDGTAELCEEWAARDERIRLLHTNRAGCPGARNAGLRACEGEYVVYLDADDLWIDSQVLSSIRERIEQTEADVLYMTSLETRRERGRTKRRNCSRTPVTSMTGDNILVGFLNCRPRWENWLFCVKTELIRTANVYYDGRMPYGEDSDWIFRLLDASRSLATLDRPCVRYTIARQGSLTATKAPEKLKAFFEAVGRWGELARDNVKADAVFRTLSNNSANHLSYLGMNRNPDRRMLLEALETSGALDRATNSAGKTARFLRKFMSLERAAVLMSARRRLLRALKLRKEGAK